MGERSLPPELVRSIQTYLHNTTGSERQLLLKLTSNSSRAWPCPISVSTKTSSDQANELDIASLLWETELNIEKNHYTLPDTAVLSLTVKGAFEAIWTTWRSENRTGICYRLSLADGTVYSGRRPLEQEMMALNEWDGKLSIHGPFPRKNRLAAQKALLEASLSDGVSAVLQVSLTGPRMLQNFCYKNARLFLR